MERSARGIDESCDFFLAEDRWEAMGLFRIGSLGDAPGLLESFDVEEPQRRQAVRNCTRRQLPLLKQLGLIFANVSRAQAIRRKVESSSKIFHCADVVACGMLRVITTLSCRAGRPAKPHENHLELRSEPPGAARSRTQWRSRSRDAV